MREASGGRNSTGWVRDNKRAKGQADGQAGGQRGGRQAGGRTDK
jgi:hypothetical protein